MGGSHLQKFTDRSHLYVEMSLLQQKKSSFHNHSRRRYMRELIKKIFCLMQFVTEGIFRWPMPRQLQTIILLSICAEFINILKIRLLMCERIQRILSGNVKKRNLSNVIANIL